MHSTASLLIFTPTWIDPATGEDAIHPECEASIKAQAGVEFDWHVTSDNPWPIYDETDRRRVESYQNVLHQYQQARAYFLHGSWSAMLTVEHDNVLPDPDAVRRLVETPGDVVYAPYMLRHGQRLLNTFQYVNDRNLGMSLSNYKHELRRARAEVVHRVSGAGFGCTLIKRHVLEQVELSGATTRDKNHCPDLRFSEDCLRKKFVSNARFDVPVMHWDGGICLHPFQSRRNSVTMYMPIDNARATAAGRFIQLIKDVPINLTDEEAGDLVRIGLVQPIAAEVQAPSASVEMQEVEIVAPARRRRAVKAQ